MKYIGYIIIGALLIISCDNYMDEDYEISEMDGAACGVFMADTTFNQFPSLALEDSLSLNASGTGNAERIDSLIAWNAEILFYPDTLIKVSKSADTSYSVIQISSAGDYVVYTNKNLKINLRDADNTIADVTNMAMDLETVADCSEDIAFRQEYTLTTGYYLTEFIMENASGFAMVILNKE